MAGKKGQKLRTITYTKTFKKNYAAMKASGRYDMSLVNTVGGLLIAHTPQQVLASEWQDHGLTPDDQWDDGDRDMHLGGDFILIYRIDQHPHNKDEDIIIFKRLGTHSELF